MKEKADNHSRSLKWEQNGELAHKDLSIPTEGDGFDLNIIVSLTIRSNGSKKLSFGSMTTLAWNPQMVLSLDKGDLVFMCPPSSTDFYHAVPASTNSSLNITMQWRKLLDK